MDINNIPCREKTFSKLIKTYSVNTGRGNKKPGSIDSKARRRCPVDKSGMLKIKIEDIFIDYCPICRGLWFDNGELTALLSKSVNREELTGSSEQNPRYNTFTKYCPDCSRKLSREICANNLLLDLCESCHGIWLDGGEFAVLYFDALADGSSNILRNLIFHYLYA